MAWYSFSGSIPLTFERRLRRHKQRFGKIDSTVVLNKDENLLWSGLQWHQSCHSNEMTLLPIILAALFLTMKSFVGAFSSDSGLDVREVKTDCKSVIGIFWDKVFIARNTVKKGKSWCLAVICRKRSAFDMQFHLIVASIFLKMCVNYVRDNSGQLLQRRISLVCIMALLLAVL